MVWLGFSLALTWHRYGPRTLVKEEIREKAVIVSQCLQSSAGPPHLQPQEC